MYVLKRVDGRSVGSWGSLYLFHPYCSMRTDIRIRLTILFFSKKKERERRRDKTITDTPPCYPEAQPYLTGKGAGKGSTVFKGRGCYLAFCPYKSIQRQY